MHRCIKSLAISLLISTVGPALAQSEHEGHHPEGPQAQSEPSPGPAGPAEAMPMMQNMPDQCRSMMQDMSQDCMNAMQQMMHGGMIQDSARPMGDSSDAPDFTKAYLEAMDRMHLPMMEGAKAEDPDVAFVRGMIPHHQGAIDMAKVVQQYGDDEETKEWATRIIEAQEGEIAEMKAWLEKNAR